MVGRKKRKKSVIFPIVVSHNNSFLVWLLLVEVRAFPSLLSSVDVLIQAKLPSRHLSMYNPGSMLLNVN